MVASVAKTGGSFLGGGEGLGLQPVCASCASWQGRVLPWAGMSTDPLSERETEKDTWQKIQEMLYRTFLFYWAKLFKAFYF